MPTTSVVTATIRAGQSLSDSIDCSTGDPVFIVGPTDWTPANISFQLSADGVTFGDWFTNDGKEVVMPCRAGTAWLCVSDIGGAKGAHVKVRSGSRDGPVIQQADRVFKIVVVA